MQGCLENPKQCVTWAQKLLKAAGRCWLTCDWFLDRAVTIYRLSSHHISTTNTPHILTSESCFACEWVLVYCIWGSGMFICPLKWRFPSSILPVSAFFFKFQILFKNPAARLHVSSASLHLPSSLHLIWISDDVFSVLANELYSE